MTSRSFLPLFSFTAMIAVLTIFTACSKPSAPSASTDKNNKGEEQAAADNTNSPPAETSSKDTAAGEATAVNESTATAQTTSGEKLTAGGVKPAQDDTLLLFYPDDPDTLNLITSNDNISAAFQRLVYEGLAEPQMDNPSKWLPSLAESWTFDPETLEFDIKLRKGVKWHPMKLPNGKLLPETEFTARDVKFTFDCILNEFTEAASMRSYYQNPEKSGADKNKIDVKIVDKHRVKIRWKEPYFRAEEFTLGVPIMPRHVYGVDEKGEPISFDFTSKEFADGFNNHWANTKMCGTGPMIFKEWNKGIDVSLERNPNYWGDPYYFSRILYKYITNNQTSRQQLLQQDLDFGGIADKDQYLQAKEHANVKSGKVVPREFQQTAYRYIGWNLKNEKFADPKVRMALSHAVPVDSFIKDIYYNLAVRQTGPFVEGGPFASPNVKPIPFDLEKAKALLAEAGWKDTNDNGTLDKVIDGKTVEFKFDMMIFPDSPTYQAMAVIIQENLRKLGIDVTISPTKWALMLQKLRKKEFDATILGWAADWKSDPYQIWHGSQADVPESSNSIGYQNPEVDKLIDELRVTVDEKKQIEIYHKIHEILYADQPYTFLFSEKGTGLMNSRLEGWKEYPMLRPHYDSREWHAKTPRRQGK